MVSNPSVKIAFVSVGIAVDTYTGVRLPEEGIMTKFAVGDDVFIFGSDTRIRINAVITAVGINALGEHCYEVKAERSPIGFGKRTFFDC